MTTWAGLRYRQSLLYLQRRHRRRVTVIVSIFRYRQEDREEEREKGYLKTPLRADVVVLQAVFEGLAQDGGLLVPHFIPDVSNEYKKWKNLSFHELAYQIAKPYVGDEIPEADLRDLMKRSYANFKDKDIVPTKKVGDVHIMELFHGPTFAFKDVALQALGNLFEYFLTRSNKRITVVGATSGDTGSAAIYGLRGKKNVECFILFPEGRVSPIQQLQMTSVLDENVHCVAVQGTFDDCQDIVK
eukprot:763465-Hanusia_phi.AAC.1